ncbi:MAG: competence protein ComEC [Bacteroidetes bacterium]|nr:MAG: competence protein ComEC [Bacteroidota bacterium]
MKNFFARAPVVRLLIPFVAGIVAAILLHVRLPLIPALFLVALCCAGLIYFLRKPMFLLKRPGLDGWLIHLALLAGGFCMAGLHTPDLSENYFGKYENREVTILAKVSEAPALKEKSVKLILEPVTLRDSSAWQPVSGKLLCYVQKNAAAAQLKYGDVIFLRVKPEPVKAPKNPGEFDYRHYLSMHGIYHQGYADSAAWKRAGAGSGNPVKAAALDTRQKLVRIFEAHGIAGQELAVASALILGDDDRIDPGLIRAYSASGALHVLSVSGLHVAIIYVVFNLLLKFLDRFPRGGIIKAILLLLLLWGYAALTGFSPSVLRSATMFSFVIVGQSMQRRQDIFNTLATSAFLLLLIDPYLVFDVGFQLSYVAVAGIVGLQPLISNWYEPKNWLMKQVWTITSVSIAAQLATFPMGLYYFHQFPTYFLLANLFVIPLSTLVIYAGVGLLLVSAIPYLSTAIGWILNGSIRLLNGSVQFTEQLPGAVVSSGNWNGWQLLLFYILILFTVLFFLQKKKLHLQLILSATILFLLLGIVESFSHNGREQLVVYSLQKSTALGFISGRQQVLIADSSFLQQENGLSYHIQPYQSQCSIKNTTQHILESDTAFTEPFVARKSGLFSFRGHLLYIAGKERSLLAGEISPVDLLLLTENTRIPLDSLLRIYQPKQVAADGSNGKKKTQDWELLCRERHIPFHNIREQGALVLEY